MAVPQTFTENEGTAQIVGEKAGADGNENHFRVSTDTLDHVLGDSTAAVLKLDVEGHEAAVLRGASEALRAHRIRHVIYEDFVGAASETSALLQEHGYSIVRIAARLSGPVLVEGDVQVQELYEPPSFLASCDLDRVRERCAARGWTVLRSSLRRQT